MPLVSLKRSPAERKKMTEPMAAGPEVDDYPYGCALDLNGELLDKLGVKDLPEIGDEYQVRAVGKVTRVSANASEGRSDRSLCIQLTGLELVHGDAGEESAAEDKGETSGPRLVTALSNSMRGRGG